jgi:hypothetical protein
MDTQQFTHAAQELINKGATIAQQYKNPSLMPIHLLYAATADEFC